MIDMNFDLDYIRKCSSMIKEFPVYTEAEKKQVAEGRTCIKLSKGQPIYPRNFKKRRDTFAGADYTTANPRDIDPNNIYIPPYFRLRSSWLLSLTSIGLSCLTGYLIMILS